MTAHQIDLANPVNFDHPLSRGLKAWWLPVPDTFGGSRVVDLCQRHHGQMVGMVPAQDWIPGPSGQWGAWSFNGTTKRVDVGTPWNSSGPITLAFWNYSATGHGNQGIGGEGDSGSERCSCHVPWGDGNVYWDYGTINGGGRLVASYAGYHNQWTRVVLVSEGLGGFHQAIYLDGERLHFKNATTDGPAGPISFNIGAALLAVENLYHWGRITSMSLHDRVWSPDEVRWDYELAQNYHSGMLNRPTTESHFLCTLRSPTVPPPLFMTQRMVGC